MKKIISRRVLFVFTLMAAAFLSFAMLELSVLPLKYYIPFVVVIFMITLLLYRFEKDKNQEHPVKVSLIKFINILFAVALIWGSLSVIKGSDFLSRITGNKEQTIQMDVIVLKTSSYQELSDLKGQVFGGNTAIDAVNINKTEAFIEDEIGAIDVKALTTYKESMAALENQEIQAMIMKDIDYESLDGVDASFREKTRIIKTIFLKIPSATANAAQVTKEPFHVLISGTDKSGPIDTFALSDVNMVATINPVTKQVLLTSIPRDYFVDIKGMAGVSGKDKLTHSAKGGVTCTIDTVEELLGIKINYYAKFNFTSFINVVDALGGVTVDVPKYDVVGRSDGVFVTKKGKYTIKPGKNDFNANQALSFVRERKAFMEGDDIRGKNQMLMLKAILKKCTSPSVITKMDSVFASLSDSFETNMSASEVKSLIQMQIDDMASWDVQSYHMYGDVSKRVTSLATVGDVTSVNPNGVYVTIPFEDSILKAKEYIQVVMAGQTILKVKDE